MPNLPQSTLDYLDHGAIDGERNNSAFKHANQFRDSGYDIDSAISNILPRALADGLPEGESRRAIDSAYKGERRDPAKGSRSSFRTIKKPTKNLKPAKKIDPKALPPEIPDGAATLIRTCFREKEWIALGITFEDEDGQRKPAGGTTFQYESLLALIDKRGIQKMFSDPYGLFVRVNPVCEDGKSNKDVTAWRHVLVEFDRDETGANIAKEWQYSAVLDSGMPVSVLLDSGNKSIHAWIRVNARNEKEYKDRVEVVWDYFSNLYLDPQNRNASRYSRMPGVRRNIAKPGEEQRFGHQRLLGVNIGASSWEEWERSLAEHSRHLEAFRSAMCSALDMVRLEVTAKPAIIGDWFLEGDIGFVFAARGVGKTWFGMALSHAASTNTPFGPWESSGGPRKVLYVDGEVSASDVQKRNTALDIDTENLVYLNHELLFERKQETMDIADPEQQKAFMELCVENEFKIVVLDNLSCLAPMCDENDGYVWSSQLLNWVLDLRRRGIAIIFIQHAGRNGQMRGHSRREDPANWIIRLNEVSSIEPHKGAVFTSSFKKNRNAPKWPSNYAWQFRPNGDQTVITVLQADNYDQFRMHVENGMVKNEELAEELQVTRGYISQLAAKGAKDGWMFINAKTKQYVVKGQNH